MSDVAEIVESLDLDAALARTYERHAELHHQGVVRRRRILGGGLVAAALAVIVPLALRPGPAQHVRIPAVADSPATSTTLDPDGTLPVPAGYRLSLGEVSTLTSTSPIPDDASAASGAAASSAATERASALRSSPGPVLRSVTVHLACGHHPEQISMVRYEVRPDALVVDAELSFAPDAQPCTASDAGLDITLPLAAPLPAGLPVVAGSVQSH